jgi:hypothetical protein
MVMSLLGSGGGELEVEGVVDVLDVICSGLGQGLNIYIDER